MALNKIIIHWTAGTYHPTEHEYQCYHYLITGDALLVLGRCIPEDNENCYDGKYAQHCGGGNTGAIGIACCGMANFKNSKNVGQYPLKKPQVEKLFKTIAEVSKKYKIPITKDNVMTHYEFGLKHPNTSSKGKIDIIYLPPYPWISAKEMGDFIRSKAIWYLKNM